MASTDAGLMMVGSLAAAALFPPLKFFFGWLTKDITISSGRSFLAAAAAAAVAVVTGFD